MKCKICGKHFTPSLHQKKYCCKECSEIARLNNSRKLAKERYKKIKPELLLYLKEYRATHKEYFKKYYLEHKEELKLKRCLL